MSDYNRFVSYIYLYENGVKTMNAGFVKVESRGGQCRINLVLKNIYTGLERCRVYMFIRFGQDLRGIYMGDVQIKNHGGDWNFLTDTNNIAGSGYRLDQMSGMVIRGDSNKFYGTRWDNGDLDIQRFQTRWDGPGTSETAGLTEEEETAVREEGTVPEERDAREEETVPEERAVREEETVPEERAVQEEETVPEETVVSEDRVVPQEASAPEKEGKMVTMEENERCREFGKILEQCPGMYPFEDDRVEACVRLEPQDIGRMPIDCWAYGSNSFLLHGYYSYRHLILARMKAEATGHYILGVPGTRHSREAFMANMFGFREFKPIREGNEESSDFGYWYTFLA